MSQIPADFSLEKFKSAQSAKSADYFHSEAIQAFAHAAQPGALKVYVEP